MTDLAIRTTEIADRIGDVLDILADTSEKVDNRAVAYAIAQQIRLRLDRALKASRDDIIVAMERDGLKQLGPVTIKSSAVDPTYPCNDRENWEDSTVQDSMAEIAMRDETRRYIRRIPPHLEIDVPVLAEDVVAGIPAARALYGLLNEKGWRREVARRLSLDVRPPRKGTE
jgi:hypothetical protein